MSVDPVAIVSASLAQVCTLDRCKLNKNAFWLSPKVLDIPVSSVQL